MKTSEGVIEVYNESKNISANSYFQYTRDDIGEESRSGVHSISTNIFSSLMNLIISLHQMSRPYLGVHLKHLEHPIPKFPGMLNHMGITRWPISWNARVMSWRMCAGIRWKLPLWRISYDIELQRYVLRQVPGDIHVICGMAWLRCWCEKRWE